MESTPKPSPRNDSRIISTPTQSQHSTPKQTPVRSEVQPNIKEPLIKQKSVKSVENTPTSTPHKQTPNTNKSGATIDPKAEKVKSIITTVKEKKKSLRNYEKDKEDLEEKIASLKREIAVWMKNIGKKTLRYGDHSFNSTTKIKVPRTESRDVLDVVEDLFGEEKLEKVVKQLDKLHSAKYDGQYQIRIVDSKKKQQEQIKVRKRARSTSDKDNNARKIRKKEILEL